MVGTLVLDCVWAKQLWLWIYIANGIGYNLIWHYYFHSTHLDI